MIAQLDRLRPVDLDELTARASLLTRVDRKYLLPATALPALLDGLAGQVRVLEIGPRRDFGYRSVYFDTPELSCYLDAAHRRPRRHKIRIRSYLDSGQRFLEVKTRGWRGETVKQRVPHDGTDAELDVSARAHADRLLAGAGIPARADLLRATLSTCYRRTTLFVPATGVRVTIDTDLCWALPDGRELRAPQRVIVETKSARAASTADRLLWSLGHRPCAVSKYATGLAALRADLPANRWRPVLRRHFPTTAKELSR